MAFLFLEGITWIIYPLPILLLLIILYCRKQRKQPFSGPDYSYIEWVNYSAQKTREPPLDPSVRESSPKSQEPVSVIALAESPAVTGESTAQASKAEQPAQAASTSLPAILDFD